MALFGRREIEVPSPGDALPGRAEAIPVSEPHFVLGTSLLPPFPEGFGTIVVGMGCFWGAERKYWEASGVYTTAAGYAGGATPNPTYQEVCSGMTGHTEVVLAVYDPELTSYDTMLKIFWENHDPTQGMRQGNDVGSQYRSALYTFDDDQVEAAAKSQAVFAATLDGAGMGPITTEVGPAPEFYYAEDYHQQYLAKNPNGYCGIGGTGLSCNL